MASLLVVFVCVAGSGAKVRPDCHLPHLHLCGCEDKKAPDSADEALLVSLDFTCTHHVTLLTCTFILLFALLIILHLSPTLLQSLSRAVTPTSTYVDSVPCL